MKWLTTVNTIEQGLASGEIQLILGNTHNLSEEYISSVAHTKRFLERWTGDPKFRELAAVDAKSAAEAYGLQQDPEEIRLLWDAKFLRTQHKQGDPVPLTVKRYESFIREKLAYRDTIRTDTQPDDVHFNEWRVRQIHRTFSELGVLRAHGIVHAPVVFELSKGCSVGCWFCGVSAPKLGGSLEYDSGMELWRGVLSVVHKIVGKAASRGFCYWASDPLDNLDYEKFLIDFHAEFDRFPQTTTAIPQRNFERTRDLLNLALSKNGELNRFSIITLGQLDKVHAEFSAEELLLVELVTQNKGALTGKAVAGRAREERNKRILEGHNQSADPEITSTIACVSGFLISMVDREIRLVSPCNASEKWPLGYRIFETGHFSNAEEFEQLMSGMIARHMTTSINFDSYVRIRSSLSFESHENGFSLCTPGSRMTYIDEPFWIAVGEMFKNGSINGSEFCIGDISLKLLDYDIPLEESLYYFRQMFKESIFDDEPEWQPSPGLALA